MFPGRTDAANVLRLGPFSFSASTSVAANYSTNVDQARPSDTELEQRDFFFIYGLNLAGEAPLGPRAQLNLSWSLEWERYLERTDLDTDADDPLGNARIEIPWELGPGLTLSAFAAYDHSLETRETAFAGGERNQRDENTITSYGLALNYARGRLRAVADYISERERHVLEEFQDGDEDRETFSFITSYALLPRLRGVYEFERERTDSVRDPNDYTGPEDTYAIGFDVDLWLRPSLIYGFRYEREDLEGEVGSWDPTLTLTFSYDLLEHPTITLQAFASYTYERTPEEDDVAFEYGLDLTHRIDSLTTQTLGMRREPVDTFGSTTDTTVTEWIYGLNRSHFLLPAISAAMTLSYTINEPSDSSIPEEEILEFEFTLAHSRRVTAQLSRTLSYTYSLEDSSLERELLDEHLITLEYTYAF